MKMEYRKKIIFGILLIIGLGIFLRAYNFSDWLHFELDQARDAKIAIKASEEGIGYLPLQGPRAAGSFLRLGPTFYYMEYLGAKLFGATPPAVAAPVLILSILTMPLFYLFVRRFFNTRISIGLLAVFSVSLFLVMYSRFAWNPNTIPFFMILTIYALLRAVDENDKNKNIWILVSAFALAVGTQLHFLVFMILPTIAAIFLLIKRPRLKIWAWSAAVAIIALFYSPMIINDVKTGGENAQEFMAAVTKKSDKNDRNLAEKFIRNYSEHSLGGFLIISAQEQAELPKIDVNGKLTDLFDSKCDFMCRKNLPLGMVAVFLYTVGIALVFRGAFIRERGVKKDFMMICAVWFAAAFVVMTPLSYDIAPRFFLVTAPLTFVFLGAVLEFSDRFFKKRWISTVIVVVLILLNLFAVQKRFTEMANAPYEGVEIASDRILKERARVTLEQQEMIVDYLESFHRANGYPVYLQSEPFYARSFVFLLDRRGIKQDVLAVNNVYEEGNYFMVLRTVSNSENRLGKYAQSYEAIGEKQFGTMVVFHLEPKREAITAEKQVFKPAKVDCKASSSSVQKRYTWNEIFGKGECFEEEKGEAEVD